MIHMLVPAHRGGVYDFARKLQETVGESRVQMVQLSEANAATWEIGRAHV